MHLDEFIKTLYDCVTGSSADSVVALLNDNETLVKDQGWKILTLLTEIALEQVLDENGKENFKTLLAYMVSNCNSKEILFGLLEMCQAFTSPSLFLLVLPHLTETVLLLPLKRVSLDIILDTASSHVKGIPWLEEYCITVSDAGQLNSTHSNSVVELLTCVEKIITELASPLWDAHSSVYEAKHRDMFVDFLLKLLHFPLLYLYNDNQLVASCCNRAIELLSMIVPTFSNLLRLPTSQSTRFTGGNTLQTPAYHALAQTSKVSGIAHLLYLVFCEHETDNQFPCVYTGAHRLTMLLPFLNDFYCQSTNSVVVYKTQKLLGSLLKSVPDSSLHEELCSLPELRSFIPYSYHCMQYCELEPLRKAASELLNTFLVKISVKSK